MSNLHEMIREYKGEQISVATASQQITSEANKLLQQGKQQIS